MLEAESSSSDSSPDKDSSSALRRQILTANRIRQMTLVTAILVVARQHRLIIIAAIHRPAVGEMTVGHHPHHVTLIGTRLPTAGQMTAARHRHHLAFAGMTIDVAAMVVIVVSPMHGIVDAATRFRGVHLVLVDVTSVSVHHRHERAVESGSGTVIGTPAATAPTSEQRQKGVFTAALNTPHDAVLEELHSHPTGQDLSCV
jgi:hypothetical protein